MKLGDACSSNSLVLMRWVAYRFTIKSRGLGWLVRGLQEEIWDHQGASRYGRVPLGVTVFACFFSSYLEAFAIHGA